MFIFKNHCVYISDKKKAKCYSLHKQQHVINGTYLKNEASVSNVAYLKFSLFEFSLFIYYLKLLFDFFLFSGIFTVHCVSFS